MDKEKYVKRARVLCFRNVRYTNDGVWFDYDVDGKEYSFFAKVHHALITLGPEQLYFVAVHIGLTYLIDIANVCLPFKIVIRTMKLPKAAVLFWEEMYKNIVMERIYSEQLSIQCRDAEWVARGRTFLEPMEFTPFFSGPLLAMSGGKDSLTALKVFNAVENLTLFFMHYTDSTWFYTQKAYRKLSKQYPALKITTNIVNLESLESLYGCKEYCMFIIGQIVFTSLLWSDQYQYLVIGNEYSANFGNTVYEGILVNHQYDKTLAVAHKINQYIHTFINRNYIYFSPFFGLYEYKIFELFFSDSRYLDIWTSCNESSSQANFCCQCPKCAFMYVFSLVFTSKKILRKYFLKDLLDDISLYKPLVDFNGVKPLDCVGEKEEVWLALYQIYQQKKDQSSPVMRYFLANILPKIEAQIPNFEQKLNREHADLQWVPPLFRELVSDAIVGGTGKPE